MLNVSRTYSIATLAFALITTIPAGLLFFVGIMRLSVVHIMFWGAVIAIVWGLYYGIRAKNKFSFWASLILISLLWILLLGRTIMRIHFVIENGGMERADGDGSPLAFLIGLLGEQLFFVPACFVLLTGWFQVLTMRRTKSGDGQALA